MSKTKSEKLKAKSEIGQVLIIALVFLSVVLITTLSIFSLVSFFTRNATIGYFAEQALHLAEAGVDKAVYKLNTQGSSYTGEPNTALGNGTFTVAISDISFGVKEITSTGFIPNSTNPAAQKKVKVRVTTGTSTIAFHYAVQIGDGGLHMDSNSVINGNAYSNGNITGSSNSKINGDAYAVGTISSPAPIVTGTKNPGAAPQPMPEFDAVYWKDQANKNNDPIIPPSGTLTITGSQTLGPRKIQGNLTIASNASLTLTGPLFVTGDFYVDSNTDIFIDSALGSSGTVIVADGKIRLGANSRVHPTTSIPKGYVLFASTKADLVLPVLDLDSNAAAGVFYALSGLARLDSNSKATALVAQKLHLDSNSIFDYDQGLASASFTSGPGGAWEIVSGTYKID